MYESVAIGYTISYVRSPFQDGINKVQNDIQVTITD